MIIVSDTDAVLQRSAERRGRAAVGQESLGSCAADVDALDRLVLLGVADVLARETDICAVDGCPRTALADKLEVASEHRWVVDRWLTDLVASGIVTAEAGRVRLTDRPRRKDLAAARERMVGACARLGYDSSLPVLLLDSLRHARGLLRGQVSVQSILFPDGDATAALEVYGSNVVSRYLNAAAASVVSDLANDRGTALRILELGAGVGVTTEHILDSVGTARIGRYVVTDLSPHLLDVARARFDDAWTNVTTYAAVDITHPIGAQLAASAAPRTYDVVLAATMAHNAIDVDVLMREVYDLLEPGGVVVLIETVVERAQSLTTMPFALSMPDGSGPPARSDVRAGSHRTYLTTAEWTAAMTGAGMRPCVDLPRADDPLDAFSQRLLVATRPAATPRTPETTE